MYHDNYTGGFSCIDPECFDEISKGHASVSSGAGLLADGLGDVSGKNLTEIMSPLTMSQQMLLLCYVSGQIEHSDWQSCLEGDPILSAHFSLMWSSRLGRTNEENLT